MQPVIAAAGIDAQTVRSAKLTCLHLCAALTPSGFFTVLRHPLSATGDFLGIIDQGGIIRSPEIFAASACSLAQSRGCRGILADFQRPALAETVSALDQCAVRLHLSCTIPLALISYAPNSCCLVDTAISGGSLERRLTQLIEQYGKHRLVIQLVRSCAGFSIPCADANGTPLLPSDVDLLCQTYDTVPFFSRELCAKYFTYTDNGQPHFVLFDDRETLHAKRELLHALGLEQQILVFPDAALLGLLSPEKRAP